MNEIIQNMANQENNNKVEDNLFVKNIIVSKQNNKNRSIPYIATERWLEQLGNRIKLSY